MFKNIAGQIIVVYAYDTIADEPKTGDATNITAYLSKDGGGAVQTNDINPTELDATNLKGLYIFNMTQPESNADILALSAISSTGNVVLDPVAIYTVTPMRGTDNAALASICTEGRLSELDASNLPTDIAAIPAGVWSYGSRTLTSFGTLIADIWASVSRTLTDKTGFEISGTKTKLDDLNDLSLGEIQGEIQNGVLAKRIVITGDPFSIVEGNVKTLIITLGSEWDLTNKFVYFVMSKINSSDDPIINRLVDSITDAVNGVAEIDLLSTETTPQGCYKYQVELRDDPADDDPETAMEGTVEITENLRS